MDGLQKEDEKLPIGTTAIVVVVAIILSFLISMTLISVLGPDGSGTSVDTGTVIVQITPENNQGTIQVNLQNDEDLGAVETS